MIVRLVLVLALGTCIKADGVNMGTCSMSCEGDIGAHFTGLPTRSRVAGPPGKRGPQGNKGDSGNIGGKGQKGNQAEPCICPDQQLLLNQIQEIREEVRRMHTPRNCSEVLLNSYGGGVVTIYPTGDLALEVYCNTVTDGGWIVFQRRMDGSENFFRGWNDYVKGFGNLNGEFWLGLDPIYKLMRTGNFELRVDMEDFDSDKRYAKYGTFSVGPPEGFYSTNITGYSGDAGNSLEIRNLMFTTKDQDHDTHPPGNCATSYKGGWWYGACHGANLNGLYLRGDHKSYANGVNWYAFRGHHHSLKFVEMKMRKIV